jgi:hypothetical protein
MATAGQLLASGSTVADGSTASTHLLNLGGGGFFYGGEFSLSLSGGSVELSTETMTSDISRLELVRGDLSMALHITELETCL